jgi:elongation factor P
MISASEFKRGARIELEGDPYVIMDVRFQSPSARGAATLVKAKMRNLRTGNVFDRTFRSADKVAEPQLELRTSSSRWGPMRLPTMPCISLMV